MTALVSRLRPVLAIVGLERVEKNQVGVRGRDLRDDASGHEKARFVVGKDLHERRAVVVVAHCERKRDPSVGKWLQERGGEAEVLHPPARRGEVAEHDGVCRERPEGQDLRDELRQHDARLRRAVLPPRRVVQQMYVGEKRDQVGVVFGSVRNRADAPLQRRRADASNEISARNAHGYLMIIANPFGGGRTVNLCQSMFAQSPPLADIHERRFQPATSASWETLTSVVTPPFNL